MMARNSSALAKRNYGRRPHPWAVKVIGLTGSIGMGKSTAAAMLKRMKVAVFDADAVVHELTGPNGSALEALARRFPSAVGLQGVDRQSLGKLVFADAAALADLERILHPLVRQRRQRFLQKHALRRTRTVVLDVPLLFETKGDAACDSVIVVTAPAFLQRQRVLARPGMTEDKLAGVLARQMPDYLKRRRAGIVITSGLGKRETWRRLNLALHARSQSRVRGNF